MEEIVMPEQNIDSQELMKLLERVVRLETRFEEQGDLPNKVEQLWRWALAIITLAVILGLSGAYFVQKFESARVELREAEESMESIQLAMNNLRENELPEMLVLAKSEIDNFSTLKQEEIDQRISSKLDTIFPNSNNMQLDQWHRASSSGFLRLQTGGTADTVAIAWVDSQQNATRTGNRLRVQGYNSGLLLVQRGEYFRAERDAGTGNVTLIWYPIGEI